MADTLTLLPDPAPPPRRPTAAAIGEALAQSPDILLSLVRELPRASMERTIATALGRALADVLRAEAIALVREWIAGEVPARAGKALDAACERYQWGIGGYGSLASEVRDRLADEVQRRLVRQAEVLVAGLVSRLEIGLKETDYGC